MWPEFEPPEYAVWRGIKARCYNPKHVDYCYYGGKGIGMFPEWRDSFRAFQAGVGPRPSRKHTLDRIDSSKDYEPGNVRWATITEQNRNRSNVVRIPHNGGTITVPEAAELEGITERAMRYRVTKHGPDSEKIWLRKKS